MYHMGTHLISFTLPMYIVDPISVSPNRMHCMIAICFCTQAVPRPFAAL